MDVSKKKNNNILDEGYTIVENVFNADEMNSINDF